MKVGRARARAVGMVMMELYVLSDSSVAPAEEYNGLLTAYGRSVLVHKMYQVSFLRDVHHRSGALRVRKHVFNDHRTCISKNYKHNIHLIYGS